MRTPNMVRRIVKKVKKRFLKLKKEKTKRVSVAPAVRWYDYHGGHNHKTKTFKMNKRMGY